MKTALKRGLIGLPKPWKEEQEQPKPATPKKQQPLQIAKANLVSQSWAVKTPYMTSTRPRKVNDNLVPASYSGSYEPKNYDARDSILVKIRKPGKFKLVRRTDDNWDRTMSASSSNLVPAVKVEVIPIASRNVWSNYRYNRGIKGHHKGIDIGSPIAGRPDNSPVYNLQDGNIYIAKVQTNKRGRVVGFGPYVGIDHGTHVCIFGHLPKIPVNPTTGKPWKNGDFVKKGQKIADTMSTNGNATGFVLHIEARLKKGDKLGAVRDPRNFHPELMALRRQ